VKADTSDVISAGHSRLTSRRLQVLGVALVLTALVVALVATVHYQGQATSLRHRLRTAGHPAPARAGPPAVSASLYSLPGGTSLTGDVAVVSVRSGSGPAQIVLTARLTGARPHTRYELVGLNCTSNGSARSWAAGTSDAHGTVQLTGSGQAVSRDDFYAIQLSPSSLRSGPGLHGYLTDADGLRPIRNGAAPCAP
jgi:hypothetical protein